MLTNAHVGASGSALQLATARRDAARTAASSAASSFFSVGGGISLCTRRDAEDDGLGRQCATISNTVGESGSHALRMQFRAYLRSALFRSFSATSTLRDVAIAARSFPSGGYPCFSASAA